MYAVKNPWQYTYPAPAGKGFVKKRQKRVEVFSKPPIRFNIKTGAVVPLSLGLSAGALLCGYWDFIRACHKSATLDDGATPGASIAVHTYGDFLDFNPRAHAIVPDRYFLGGGDFQMAPW
jgi:hypothetical protein